MNSLSVAVVQMVSTADFEQNLLQASRLIDEAANKGARLILLPENCFMFSAANFYALAKQEMETHIMENFLSEQSKKYHCYVVAGSLPVLSGESKKVYSASCVYAPDGKRIASYYKVHLFDVDVADNVGSYRESESITSGRDIVSFELDGIRVGLSICYDLRFPELYRKLAAQGCNILLVPAAFTFVTGEKHWEILLRARAIENQCFVLAANQGGEHVSASGQVRKTYGHSMIIDADGFIRASLEMGEGVLVRELDVEAQIAIRKKMPVLQHRRLDC